MIGAESPLARLLKKENGMATKVTVKADCAKNKEILVSLQEKGALTSRIVLESGKEIAVDVTSIKSVSVMEREKQPEPKPEKAVKEKETITKDDVGELKA